MWGRQVDPNHVPLVPTFAVATNVYPTRTLLCATSDGGFVVAWDTSFSGEISFRRYDSTDRQTLAAAEGDFRWQVPDRSRHEGNDDCTDVREHSIARQDNGRPATNWR